jgi:tetratricopeptide (TPR) repeat protein
MLMSKTGYNRYLFILAVSAGIAAFLLYLPSLQNGFVNWDDDAYIYRNPFIHPLDAGFFRWAFFDFYDANYHPLTWISHALDYAAWGLNPAGHHLTNNILHAANTFVVVLLVARLMASRQAGKLTGPHISRFTLVAAVTTGLLFGVHPLHVESVAWVAERKDLLCAFFYLLSIMAYVKYAGAISSQSTKGIAQGNKDNIQDSERKEQGAVSSMRHALGPMLSALCFFILALLSKPMAVTLPAVLLLLDWYPFGRMSSLKAFRAACVEKLPFFALSLAASAVAVLSQRSGDAIISTKVAPLPARLAVAAEGVFSYIRNMILPADLVPFYPYPEQVSLASPKYFSFFLLFIAVSAACFVLRKKRKVWLAAWSYYLITLLPVIGIIQIGFQSRADRYTYLPSLGPFLIVGLGAAWVYEKLTEKESNILKAAAAVTGAGVIVLMSYATVKQTGIWKNSLVLWNYVLETKAEKSAVAYYHRGIAYYDLKLFDLAIQDYDRAIRMKSDFYQAYNNRAVSYEETGQLDLAVRDYDQSVSLEPQCKVLANRGFLYLKKEMRDKAEEDFRRAVKQDPKCAEAYNGFGMLHFLKGQNESALENFTRTIKLNPTHASAFFNRGYAHLRRGEKDRAVTDFREACRLQNQNGCDAARRLTGS